MAIRNTPASYGSAARALHWLTALLILTAVGLGLYASDLPRTTDAEVARLAGLYSLHKTIGVAAFFTAAARILWALTQPRPAPLHPDRRLETLGAEVVHWALYGAMLVMPLSGWIHHAAVTGFAPILLPFGQTLPFVPQSAGLGDVASAIHEISATVLYIAIGLHVLGALKHALIDRDATLTRITRGAVAPANPVAHRSLAAPGLAVLIWAGVIGAGILLPPETEAAPASAPTETAAAPATGNWAVQSGTLSIAVQQMGSEVAGQFADWQADITYDEATRTGEVTVRIGVPTLTLGSVTDQALGADFFDAATHPVATYTAKIRPEGTGQIAEGTLDLRGATVPVTVPFTLTIDGDTATMTGTTTLDRRDFGMGATYTDESSVGFGVGVDVALTATRR